MTDKETLTVQQCNSTKLQAALDRVGEDQEYDALRLSAGVYQINKPLYMNSGTELFGPKTATLKLISRAPTTTFKPLVPILGQKDKDIHDISIHGFTFNGNSGSQLVTHGKGYHNFLYLTNGTNIDLHNLILKNSQGDGARFRACERVDMCGCTIDQIGHDAGYFLNCDTINFFANTVDLRTNSGCRTANSNHVKIFDNLIKGGSEWWRGGPGIQIDHSDFTIVDDLEIYGNGLYQTFGPAFWLSNYGVASTDLSLCKDYKIHDNMIVECGLNPSIDWVGGLIWSGVDNVDFSYNTLVNCYRYGIAGHVGSSVWGTRPKGKGYTLTARNNLIGGTLTGLWKNGIANGYGVALTMYVTHSINSEGNHVWENSGGNYLNVDSKTDTNEPVELDDNYYPVDPMIDCGCRKDDP